MFLMRVTTSSCATGTIEPVIRGVFGVCPVAAAAAAAAAAAVAAVNGLLFVESASGLSKISVEVADDAAVVDVAADVADDGVGGSNSSDCSKLHGGSIFKPNSL